MFTKIIPYAFAFISIPAEVFPIHIKIPLTESYRFIRREKYANIFQSFFEHHFLLYLLTNCCRTEIQKCIIKTIKGLNMTEIHKYPKVIVSVMK